MLGLRGGVGLGETDLRSTGLLPEGVNEAGLLSTPESSRFLGVETHPFSSTDVSVIGHGYVDIICKIEPRTTYCCRSLVYLALLHGHI